MRETICFILVHQFRWYIYTLIYLIGVLISVILNHKTSHVKTHFWFSVNNVFNSISKYKTKYGKWKKQLLCDSDCVELWKASWQNNTHAGPDRTGGRSSVCVCVCETVSLVVAGVCMCHFKGADRLSRPPGVVCARVPSTLGTRKGSGGRGGENIPINKTSSGTRRVNRADFGGIHSMRISALCCLWKTQRKKMIEANKWRWFDRLFSPKVMLFF